MPTKLEYLLTRAPKPFSLSPYDSDLITNALVMEQVVGTLIKYGGQGRYEPYLAEKWFPANGGKTWTFVLKENLTNQKIEKITASKYVAALKRILSKLGSESPDLPVFSLLKGWKEFLNDPDHSNLHGLTAPNEREITFSFREKPDGFMEYLAMPYYGFYALSDFSDLSGNWMSDQKVAASGAYQIDEISKDAVILKKRKDWFSHIANSPDTVRISYSNFSEASQPLKHTIIEKKLQPEDRWHEKFNLITATPTVLAALVLSPYKEGLFADIENRKLFYSKLESAKKEVLLNLPANQVANSFYFTSPIKGDIPKSAFSSFRISGERKIQFRYYDSSNIQRTQYVKGLINKIFENEDIEVEIISDNEHGLMSSTEANKKFDIRFTTVEVGGNFENWVIRMMFCSPLGVSFPDHSGKMCELVSDYEAGKVSDEVYPDRFNSILLEDMTTIPLLHTSATWLFSNDIDLENISPSMNMPRFDQIQLK